MAVVPIRSSINGPIRFLGRVRNADGVPTINVVGNEVTLIA